jgi:hypothetical protein
MKSPNKKTQKRNIFKKDTADNCQQERVSLQGKRNKAFAVIKSDMEEKERRRKKENSKVGWEEK